MTQATDRRAPASRLHQVVESLYGRLFRIVAATGVPPSFIVTLEVKGRHSGRRHSVVLILAEHEGERYAVSVLGDNCDWVQNVRASSEGVVRHGRRKLVRLVEVPTSQRAPILKAYLKWALGARPLFEVPYSAPVQEFERIAHKHPVFRIA